MNESKNIPEEFYSSDTGKLFDKCADCERDLLVNNVQYSISKIIRQYADYTAKDVIIEFAICLRCAKKMMKKVSEDSFAAISAYQLKVMFNHEPTYEEAMNKCILSKKPKDSLLSYQMIAFCKGAYLSADSPSYIIDNAELEKVNDELSDETKDFFDDYYQNLIGPMPEWVTNDVPGGKKLVLI